MASYFLNNITIIDAISNSRYTRWNNKVQENTFVRMKNAAKLAECFFEGPHIVRERHDILLLHEVRVGGALAADTVQRNTETHNTKTNGDKW